MILHDANTGPDWLPVLALCAAWHCPPDVVLRQGIRWRARQELFTQLIRVRANPESAGGVDYDG